MIAANARIRMLRRNRIEVPVRSSIIIENPASHSQVPAMRELTGYYLEDLGVGIEDVEDLIEDLDRALKSKG